MMCSCHPSDYEARHFLDEFKSSRAGCCAALWRTLSKPSMIPGCFHLPDKAQKPKWAKPRKAHGKASAGSYTGVEAAELAANQVEQRSRLAAAYTARLGTPKSDI